MRVSESGISDFIHRHSFGWLTVTGLTCPFVVVTLLFGGAGLAYPLLSWLIFVFASLAIWTVLGKTRWSQIPPLGRAATLLGGIFGLLLLVQAVPLPVLIWQRMPGHDVAAQIADAANVHPWMAWSLAPDRTLQTILSLLPPVAGLLVMAVSAHPGRILILRIVIAFGALNAVLGIIQFAASGGAPLLFDTTHRDVGVGLFVNRNHLAIFLLMSMLLAVLPGVVRFSQQSTRTLVAVIRAIVVALLALGVVATMSRAGLVMLPFVGLCAGLQLYEGKLNVRALLLAVVIAVLGVGLFSMSQPAERILSRLEVAAEDKRFDYWENTWFLARDALPLGTGFGTFQLLYPTAEPLNEVAPDVVNRAHDDYLESFLEGGVPAALLIGFAGIIVVLAIVRARKVARTRFEQRAPWVVSLAFIVLAAASLVDYPIRMQSIALLAGLMLGLLLPTPNTETRRDAVSIRSRAAIALLLLILSTFATAAGWSDHFVRVGRPDIAVAINPVSSQAWSALATKFEIAGDATSSSQAARKALTLSPMDAAALRAEGAARIQLGDVEQGASLLSLGAKLGWRDVYTQLWLAQQALAAGADGFAVQRADAVLRQNRFFDQVLSQLPPLIAHQSGRDALAEQLSYKPGWRAAFFNQVARTKGYRVDDLLGLLTALRKRGAPVTPAETALVRAVLADAGDFADARRVWLASGGIGNIGDPGFEQGPEVPRYAAPFGWKAPDMLGVRLRYDEPSPKLSGQALALSSDGEAAGPALVQTIALSPGRYRISMYGLTRKPELLAKLGAGVACRLATSAQASPPIEAVLSWKPTKDGWFAGAGEIRVPAGCPGQDLYIAIPRAGVEPYSLWLDQVAVTPLRGVSD
ncbi:o-antigen polymerase [Novosphingobium sp. Rr 2-17]|nr:o-antigen polymerase [Novosphingobium sp. Rr 2-17]